MKVSTKVIGLFVGVCASCLHADNAFRKYVELKAGYCVPQKKDGVSYKSAPLLNGEIGIQYDNWRLGFQLGIIQYENKEVKDRAAKHYATIFNHGGDDCQNARFTALSSMLNVYYDFKLQDQVSFYVGAGCGLVRLKYHFYENAMFNANYDLVKYAFAGQLMAGVSYEISSNWMLTMGYRCMKTETVTFAHKDFNADIKPLKTPYMHSLEFGLRYQF
ncbi:MAG: outer membrane protein [Opitutales bacterium]